MAFHLLFVAVKSQLRKQTVPRKRLIQRVQQFTVLRVIEQRVQRCIYCLWFH